MRDWALRAVLKDVDTDTGSWTAVASTPTQDRDKERVVARSLYWRTNTLPCHVNHRFEVASLVGRVTPRYDSRGTLLVDGKWNTSPLAQETRRAVLDGSLTDMSIAMTDTRRRTAKDGVAEIYGAELISVDWVTVASNYEARVMAARAYRPMTPFRGQLLALQTQLELLELDLLELERRKGMAPADVRTFLRNLGGKR